MFKTTREITPAPRFTGLNHAAFLCRDAEETRRFYQDVLGMPLVVAVPLPSGINLAAAFAAELGEPAAPPPENMLTLFFQVGPSQFITFFDVPHAVSEEKFRVRDGVEEYHLAMEVATWAELLQFKRRLRDLDIAVYGPVNHQSNHSIYFFDPNGISLEITIRDQAHDAVMAYAAQTAPAGLAQWMQDTAALRSSRLAGQESRRKQAEEIKRRIASRVAATLPDYVPAGEGARS